VSERSSRTHRHGESGEVREHADMANAGDVELLVKANAASLSKWRISLSIFL
jgi:hypothetical protein